MTISSFQNLSCFCYQKPSWTVHVDWSDFCVTKERNQKGKDSTILRTASEQSRRENEQKSESNFVLVIYCYFLLFNQITLIEVICIINHMQKKVIQNNISVYLRMRITKDETRGWYFPDADAHSLLWSAGKKSIFFEKSRNSRRHRKGEKAKK